MYKYIYLNYCLHLKMPKNGVTVNTPNYRLRSYGDHNKQKIKKC